MTCASVVIPTLNRFDHLKNCVESLSRCRMADQTELIIGIDYPPAEKYRKGYDKIREYASHITGFFKVTVFEHTENLGASKNLKFLLDYAFQKSDRVILSEDDNVFAPVFLEFMNSSLELFIDNDSVSSVGGYTPPALYSSESDGLLTYDSSAWGLGLWRDKECWEKNETFAEEVLFSWKNSIKVYSKYPCLLRMLMSMYDANAIYGDALRCCRNILNNCHQFRPSISLVRNMGHDGSGLHSGKSGGKIDFHNQIISGRKDYYINVSSVISIKDKWTVFYGLPENKIRALISIMGIGLRYIRFRIKKV